MLGRGSIETVGHGYVLRADVSAIDLHRFEALSDEGIEALEDDRPREAAEILRRGLDLWHGPALADLLDETLAAAAVNRLEELRLTALEKRVDADLASGRHAEVVAELASLVDEYPLRERFRAQLMLALYRSGRQADALASYRAARAILTEELGIDPGAELQSMEQAILTQDRSLDLVEEVGQRARQVARSRRVVLAVTTGASDPSSLLDLSEALVHKPVFELIVAGLVSDRAELAPRTALLNERARELAHRGVIARAAAFVSAQLGEDIVRLASDRDVVLALLEAPATLLDKGDPGPGPGARALGGSLRRGVHWLLEVDRPTDLVVVPFGGVDHDCGGDRARRVGREGSRRSSSARRRRGDCGCRKARCEPIALPCLARSAESRGDLRRAAAGRRGGRGDALGEQGGGGPGRRPFGALATGGARAGATGVGQGRRTPRTLRPVRASSWRPRSERDPHQVHLVGWTNRAIGGFSLL